MSGSANSPNARFSYPYGVALSADGAFALVADTYNATIRRITLASGTVTTLAGSPGAAGYANGSGAAARFDFPTGIALSADGAFALVADTNNQVIRRIEVATGAVSTVAGGPGLPGSLDGTGTAARFHSPFGVVVSPDGAFALVADSYNSAIRRITLATGAVTSPYGGLGVVGSQDGVGTAARFNFPTAVALSADGAATLVADRENQTIRRITLATGEVKTLAGKAGSAGHLDGAGTAAAFDQPQSVALSGDGRLALVADAGSQTIRRIELANGQVTTVAGRPYSQGNADCAGEDARFADPQGVALSRDGATALVANTGAHTIRRLNLLGQNPKPTLTSLNPSASLAGEPGLTIQVTGADFACGARLLWDGAPRPTTYVSGTQLAASLGAADLAVASTASVSVLNPASSAGPSNALPFTIGKRPQAISFPPLPNRAADESPFGLGATTSSGLPVAYRASGVCTVTGVTVTLSGPGPCTITASQSGNATFAPAPEVTRSFTVTPPPLRPRARIGIVFG